MGSEVDACCSQFDPKLWDELEVVWEGKTFVKDRVRSLFHIPLNFGAVVARNMKAIRAAGAASDELMVLSDENSLWGADVYLSVSKNVPGVEMAVLSGTYMSKVFEGPYKDAGKWAKQMATYVSSAEKEMQALFFYYTTCPKCAKKFGKNYVVLLAEI